MSGISKEWAIFISFFLIVLGLTAAEAFWLNKKANAGLGKSLLFSFLTNFIGLTIGLLVLFVFVVVILAMAWDGSLKNFPLGDLGIGAAFVFVVILTPVLLAVSKRVFLTILKIQNGKSAWLYSFASSISVFLVSIGVPVLLGYLLLR